MHADMDNIISSGEDFIFIFVAIFPAYFLIIFLPVFRRLKNQGLFEENLVLERIIDGDMLESIF